METRRENLKIIGAVGLTCAFPFAADELYAQHPHGTEETPSKPVMPFAPQFFTAAEYATLSAICERIIPTTDTPGAIAAGVPQYIDSLVAKNTDLQKRCRDGLAHIDEVARSTYAKPYSELSEPEQIALLKPLSESGDRFFISIKNMTADGYYTSRVGLVEELGYKGNTALASFPGCNDVHEH